MHEKTPPITKSERERAVKEDTLDDIAMWFPHASVWIERYEKALQCCEKEIKNLQNALRTTNKLNDFLRDKLYKDG